MSKVSEMMAKALETAPSTVVNIAIPYSQQFIVTEPVHRLDQAVYVVPVQPHLLPCYEVLQDLTPDLPVTFDHCRAYTVPKNWKEPFTLQRIPFIDYALDHKDEPTTALLLAIALHRVNSRDHTAADVYVRNLCASRLTIIEAEYAAQRIDRDARGKSLNARQLSSTDYMALYWTIVATGHLQLAGTEYNSSMVQDFMSAQQAIARAMALQNTL